MSARAALLTFAPSTSDAASSRQATVERQVVQGVGYVSLGQLVNQLGGACALGATGVRVDYAGGNAQVSFNDTAVDASIGRFALSHPVLQAQGDVLIAVTDVGAFFRNGFRVAVTQAASAEAPPPQETPAAPAAPESVSPAQAPAPAEQAQPAPSGVTMTPLAPEPETFAPMAPPAAAPPPVAAAPQAQGGDVVDVIILDAGHGGSDVGCRGRALVEKDFTLALARRVQDALKQNVQANVWMTRDADTNVSAAQRVRTVKERRGDVLISLHAAASAAPSAHGIAVFRPPAEGPAGGSRADQQVAAQSRRMAEALADSLAKATSAEGQAPRELRCRLFSGLSVPVVLVEVGFLTNPAEEDLLKTEAFQAQVAQGIVEGLKAMAQPASPAPPASAAPPTSPAPSAPEPAKEATP